MTAARAINILTPGATRYSPIEYEEALSMAREALRYWKMTSMAPRLLEMKEDTKSGKAK